MLDRVRQSSSASRVRRSLEQEVDNELDRPKDKEREPESKIDAEQQRR